ncbi:DUF6767 domain-containing protein [Micromonospora sp. LOL_023]
MTARAQRRQPKAKCPIRPGEPCLLCLPGATGPPTAAWSTW